jgi:hypothetical protein
MALSVIPCLLFLFATAQGQTKVIANKYFDIYYPVLELESVSKDLKLASVERITISILEEEDYKIQYADNLPEWGIAFAIPEKHHILLIFPGSFQRISNLRFILAHEIAHILIHERARTFIPRWFDEGSAMHLSREPNLIDDMELLGAALMGGIIPLSQIERSFPESGRRARLAYIESLSTIDFLMEEFGPAILIQVLDRSREAHDFRQGFIKATGIDLPQFEMEWRTWIRRRFAVTVLFRPNLLFAATAVLVLILGAVARLRRMRASRIDEAIEK